MVSSPLAWGGAAVVVIAIALAALVTPALALIALVGIALVWVATNRAGTVNAYTYHGEGHDNLGGAGANDSRRAL
jgi:hypothetical protein